MRHIIRWITQNSDGHKFIGFCWNHPERTILKKGDVLVYLFTVIYLCRESWNMFHLPNIWSTGMPQPFFLLLNTLVQHISSDEHSFCTLDRQLMLDRISLYHRKLHITTIHLHSPFSAVSFIYLYLNEVQFKT